jgi:hypothetical protein
VIHDFVPLNARRHVPFTEVAIEQAASVGGFAFGDTRRARCGRGSG